jgi:hypothetical protein
MKPGAESIMELKTVITKHSHLTRVSASFPVHRHCPRSYSRRRMLVLFVVQVTPFSMELLKCSSSICSPVVILVFNEVLVRGSTNNISKVWVRVDFVAKGDKIILRVEVGHRGCKQIGVRHTNIPRDSVGTLTLTTTRDIDHNASSLGDSGATIG